MAQKRQRAVNVRLLTSIIFESHAEAANFVTGYCGVAPMIAYVVTATFKTEDGDD